MEQTTKGPAISMAEVACIFRQALRGDIPVRRKDPHWGWKSPITVCPFYFGEWEIGFFNDAMELDYTDYVIAPDGRRTEFDEWCTEKFVGCPLDELAPTEHEQLERVIARL